MSLRLVRLLSTATRPQLFNPHFPLLTKEAKKRRKREMKAQPQYHGRLLGDVTFMLTKFAPSVEESVRRRQTFMEVQAALQELCGDTFYVKDCSLHKYAMGIHEAPIECAIVDISHEASFLRPGSDPTSPHNFHGPSPVVQALVDAGFQRGFMSPLPNDNPTSQPKSPQSPLDSAIPSLEYQFTRKGAFYHTLQTTTTTLPFMLTLPGTPIFPSYNILSEISASLQHTLREFTALLYIWTRSLQINEFSPACLALMAIRCMQDTFGRDNLYIAHASKDHVSLDTSTINKKFRELLWNFFVFWRNAPSIGQRLILSVRDKENPPRQRSKVQPGSSHPAVDIWRKQCLVVQDPFSKIHNHAEGVSLEALRHFGHQCMLASHAIGRGHPLSAIFGGSFLPPIVARRVDIRSNPEHPEGLGTRYSHPNAVLPPELKSFCETVEPNHAVVNLRAQTIRRVQDTIHTNYGRQYTVELFGSTRYGVSSSSSDLDLVIIDAHRPNGFSPDVNLNKLPDIYNINKLGNTLSRSGFGKMRKIPMASVPIVKCRDLVTGLDCDINVNDQLGVLNTELIRQYCDTSTLLRPMIMFIKYWAKPLGLNNPSVAGRVVTFSSYALVLMTIGLLQTRGLLPNLQDGLPKLADDTTDGTFWLRSKLGRIRCDTRFRRAESWVPREVVTLEDALADWFIYWGYEHSYATHMVSIRDGGIIRQPPQESGGNEPLASTSISQERESKPEGGGKVATKKPSKGHAVEEYELVVKDPFILSKNVTGAISSRSIDLFRHNCQRVAKMLDWGGDLKDVCGVGGEVEGRRSPRPARKSTRVSAPPAQAESSRAKGKGKAKEVATAGKTRPQAKPAGGGESKKRQTSDKTPELHGSSREGGDKRARMGPKAADGRGSRLFDVALSDVRNYTGQPRK